MEDIRLEQSIILNLFLDRHIDFPQYVIARDASLARATPRFTDQDTAELRILMLAMKDRVMEEMLRRLAADQLVHDDEPAVSTQRAAGSRSLRSVRSIIG